MNTEGNGIPKRVSSQVLRYAWMFGCTLLVLFGALQASARTPVLDTAQKTCLWAVESGEHRVFLLGSIHFMRPDAYPLPPAIDAAYADSRVVVFETDITRMQDPRVQARMLELGTYPQGQSVFTAIGTDARRQLEQKLAQAGLSADLIGGMKPWLIALTLSSLEFMRLGFDPNLGIDMQLYSRAKSDGKQIAALETVEHQLQLLAGMDGRTQEKFLVQTLQELDQVQRMASDMFALWRTGQTEALHRLLFGTIDRYPEIRDRLLARRNQAWLEKIEDLIRHKEAALVVVGAMHLIGPGSVVDLLRQRGYQVEQQ